MTFKEELKEANKTILKSILSVVLILVAIGAIYYLWHTGYLQKIDYKAIMDKLYITEFIERLKSILGIK